MITYHDPCIMLLADREDVFEGEAIRQLKHIAALEGVQQSVGLPDLHPGYGIPVGAAFLTKEHIYPHIIGNDIGCGIGLWQTSLQVRRLRLDRWAKQLQDLGAEIEPENMAQCVESSSTGPARPPLGSIGAGNHFAELQRIKEVHDQQALMGLGLDKRNLLLLVHSGSRGIGETILRRQTDRFGAKPLPVGTEFCRDYLANHDLALEWARQNRERIAKRISRTLQGTCQGVLDICHNCVEAIDQDGLHGWLHRKGAATSDRGPLVIPGSRGSLSYLVAPQGEQSKVLFSLPHGAGRKWKRSSCRDRLRAKFPPHSLTRTPLGSIVICDSSDQLYEEAPQAYKNIERVLKCLEQEMLVRVIATLQPLITYKQRRKP